MKFIMYLSILRTPLTLETNFQCLHLTAVLLFENRISVHLLPHLSIRKGYHHFAICNKDGILGADVPGGNL